MRQSRVGSRMVGEAAPLYIIAEMACAHDGSMDKAKRLVEAAVHSRADAVQLQFFSTEHLVTPSHEVFELLRRIEFRPDQWRDLYDHARTFAIDVFACTFDIPSAELAMEFGVDGIKLNSSDLSHPDMLELVARSGLFFTLGTGASLLEEVTAALATIETAGGGNLALMHGVQNFPTNLSDAHINRVCTLGCLFEYPVGYADHTNASLELAKSIDLVALGCGARIFEKHITLSRAEKGTDYQAALEPDEFKDYVRCLRMADGALGGIRPAPLNDSDLTYRRFQKKSVVAADDIPCGTVLARNMLACLRTSGEPGLSPKRLPEILGRKVNRDIKRFETIAADWVE